jgi:hypothetical protein
MNSRATARGSLREKTSLRSSSSHITMDDLDHVFNDVLAIAGKGQSAQFVFNEVGHEATHRSASGRYPLKKDGANGIFGGFSSTWDYFLFAR